ncbi:MAG: FKBP-type peptidyl-prolyl cis-trans isomerase [Acidimicrobiales bacterium]
MRRPLFAVLVAVALLAGCGDDKADDATGTPLDDVEVTGDAGKKPTIEFDQPLEVTDTVTRVLEEGDGEEIADDAVVSFDFLFVNGRDGKELDTSYGQEPAQLVFEDSLMAGVYKGLHGVTEGSQVLVGISPEDGLADGQSQGVGKDDTLLLYADIHEVRTPLSRAEGTAVDPVPGLPTVELSDDGAPTITVPDSPPPTELVAQPLIEGKGPEVTGGQSITVHYTGVVWDTGKVFDSSWERGAPATFDIGTGDVIGGWDEGLVGHTVGSQILLVVPPDKGYPNGSPDGSIKAGDTIVFVVDILDAA